MPELNNVQTYVKLEDNDIRSPIAHFIKILEIIGVLDANLQNHYQSLEWKTEDNGFVDLHDGGNNHYQTIFPHLKVKPLVMGWTPAIDDSFTDNWLSLDLLIETSTLYSHSKQKYRESVQEGIENLVEVMASEFNQTGVYFTDEAQDGEDFQGIVQMDKSKLWNFTYALIPTSLKSFYGEAPDHYRIQKRDDWIEAWDSRFWRNGSKID